MRHYDRTEFRHLNDGQRYRDYDYMAEDGWVEREELQATPRPGSGTRGRSSPPHGAPPRARERLLGMLRHPGEALARMVRLVREVIEWARVIRQR
jgi:hypothetical protein